MEVNFIALAVPVFLLFIGIEYFFSIVKKKPLYEVKDFINNLSTGVLEQLINTPLKILLLFPYDSLYHHAGLFSVNPHFITPWVLLWVGVDFCYYWLHRASHRINLLWVGHSVHHQSEYYNFSVALRQGILQAMTTWFFYLPLALLGFPTWMFFIVISLNTLYQFWIHTQCIDRLGWLEKVFNTPSHHRVHHGINPIYIDKNFAGSLIVWDKLFGNL